MNCKFKRGENWQCGSHAFNLKQDGIDQGELCDTHYWQTQAMSLLDGALDMAELLVERIDDDDHAKQFRNELTRLRAALAKAKT